MLHIIEQARKGSESPLLLREEPGEAEIAEAVPDDAPEQVVEKGILCSACRSVITSREQEVSVQGATCHTFFNPAGIVYEIRCFTRAPGCTNKGEPTTEFTWFSGYSWEYSFCTACHEHLGWFYSSAESSFFGLIAARLIE